MQQKSCGVEVIVAFLFVESVYHFSCLYFLAIIVL